MPLTGGTRRLNEEGATALAAFTFRELLVHKRLAERAAQRGRGASAIALAAKIDRELEHRRQNKFGRQSAPDID